MRKLLVGLGAAASIAFTAAACGGGSGVSAAKAQALQHQADLYAIYRIESKWHDAETHQNTKELEALWAPNGVWQADVNTTLTGPKAIGNYFAKYVWALARRQHWESDTATFKIRVTADGNKGTLYFECHEIDAKTRKVVAVVGQDTTVAKVDGRWLITNAVGSSPMLGA
jgi:SnoaL-like domain